MYDASELWRLGKNRYKKRIPKDVKRHGLTPKERQFIIYQAGKTCQCCHKYNNKLKLYMYEGVAQGVVCDKCRRFISGAYRNQELMSNVRRFMENPPLKSKSELNEQSRG